MCTYWFRPKRFWKYFAAYYPSSWQGWVATIILASALIVTFLKVVATSHSANDTFIGMIISTIVILLIFDFLCFRTGEYPSWWKGEQK